MASKSSDVRPKITMACVDCKARNYITKKNRRNTPDRLELSKFCPTCGKQTAHRETRLAVPAHLHEGHPARPGWPSSYPGRGAASAPGAAGWPPRTTAGR